MKYKVIIADPAWQYSNSGTNGAAQKHYQTMTTDEVCALPVSTLADENAVLLLWATMPLLPDALRVVDSWGFEYVTAFPWVKLSGEPRPSLWGDWELRPAYGTGFWIRGCAELVIVARRGDARHPEADFVGLISQRFAHSRKPANLYEYAESMPGPYLELFARQPRSGWDSWGNEIDGRDLRDIQAA